MSERRRKRFFRIAGWILLGVILLLAAAAIGGGWALERWAAPILEKEASGRLGFPVSVARASFEPWAGKIHFHDVKGRAAQGEGPSSRSAVTGLSLEKITVEFSLSALVRRKPEWLKRVTLEGPAIDLDLDREPLLPSFDDGAGPAGGPSAPLPAVEVRRGELRVSKGGERISLEGIDLSFHPPGLRLSIARANGAWSLPRREALEFPLEAFARVLPGPAGLDGFAVDRLSLGGREAVQGLNIDLSKPGRASLAGRLPGWGVDVKAAEISAESADLSLELRRADIASVAGLFASGPLPDGTAGGTVRLYLPFSRPVDWSAEGEVEVESLSWQAARLEAAYLLLTLARGEAGFHGELRAQDVRAGGSQPFDLEARFQREPLADGSHRVIVKSLDLWRDGVRLAAAGVLDERSLMLEDGRIELDGLSPARFADFLPALARLPGSVGGEILLSGQLLEPSRMEARARLVWTGPGETPPRLELDADLAVLELSLEGRLQSGAADVAFDLRSGLALPLQVAFSRLEGQLAGIDFRAGIPPQIEVDEGRFRLDPSVFHTLGGTVELSSEGGLEGELVAALDAGGLRLDELPRTLPDGRIEGIVSGQARLSLRRQGEVFIPEFSLVAELHAGAARSGDRGLDAISGQAIVLADEKIIQLAVLRLDHGTQMAELSAAVPVLAWSPGPVFPAGAEAEGNLRVEVQDFGEIPLPAKFVRQVGGRLSASFQFTALPSLDPRRVLDSLSLRGRARIQDGGFWLAGRDLPPLSNLDADLAFEGRQVSLDRLAFDVRGSQYRIEGGARLDPLLETSRFGIGEVNLRLRAQDALVLREPGLRVRGNIDLHWSGAFEASRLEGYLRITRAYYLRDIQLTPAQGARLPLELFSFTDPPLAGMSFDISVTSDQGIIIRNNLASVRASADIRLGGTGREPILTGRISATSGSVQFANTKLELQNSLVEFVASDPLNPRLQINLHKTMRDYRVSVSMTGTLREPEVLLDSSPPLERDQLLVLISTGQTLDEIREEGAERAAVVMAAKYLGRRLVRYFGAGEPEEDTFFDRLTLETESARSSRYEDPIRLEYQLTRDVLTVSDYMFLQAERDEYGDYNFSLGIRFELGE